MEFNRQCAKIYYQQSQLRGKCKFNIYRLSGVFVDGILAGTLRDSWDSQESTPEPSHLRKRRDNNAAYFFFTQWQTIRVFISELDGMLITAANRSTILFNAIICRYVYRCKNFSSSYRFWETFAFVHLRVFTTFWNLISANFVKNRGLLIFATRVRGISSLIFDCSHVNYIPRDYPRDNTGSHSWRARPYRARRECQSGDSFQMKIRIALYPASRFKRRFIKSGIPLENWRTAEGVAGGKQGREDFSKDRSC